VSNALPIASTVRGEPVWEIADLFPLQGQWTEADYFNLHTNHLVEFSEGCLEFLPMPTHAHQMIVALLYGFLKSFVDAQDPGGIVLFAPLWVRLWPGKIREPDLVYMRSSHRSRIHDYWEGADLVIEVVSKGNPSHDRHTKRAEYARAGIPEFWLVDTLERQIIVHVLDEGTYREAGVYGPGTAAGSVLLAGWIVNVDAVLALLDQNQS
jgi:Uma2 family endonuclease